MNWNKAIKKLEELSEDHSREAAIIKDAAPRQAMRLIVRSDHCKDLAIALRAGL